MFIHFTIENDENEATGNEINLDICHNYLKVGGCPNYDSFVKNVYVKIRWVGRWQLKLAVCHKVYSFFGLLPLPNQAQNNDLFITCFDNNNLTIGYL